MSTDPEVLYPSLVAGAAMLVYYVQGYQVGAARQKYNIQAPATTGHPIFERHFRVHQNTMEQLVTFLPSLSLFSWLVSGRVAALLGAVFVVGRVLYGRGYVKDPKARELGAILSFLPSTLLMVGSVGAIVYSLATGNRVPKFL